MTDSMTFVKTHCLINICLPALIGLLVQSNLLAVQSEKVSGDCKIQGQYQNSPVVLSTTSRVAGAVHSLTWNGKEFIDSVDHGRQMQSASNFDAGSRFTGETFNPTEAGSRFDGAGQKTTSKLLQLKATKNSVQTKSQMAFWLRPGERSSGNLAKNRVKLSNHLLSKKITIGFERFSNVIQYEVTFFVPPNERHSYAQFEAVTGYMPAEFEMFYTIDLGTPNRRAAGIVKKVSDGPGEQHLPLILATRSGSHAMGIYSPDQPSKGYERAGYGRFRFSKQKVVKWNSVFRYKAQPIKSGNYSFRNFVIIGDLDSVAKTMIKLAQHLDNS